MNRSLNIEPVKNILGDLFGLFYPHRCPGCGSDQLAKHQRLCIKCNLDLPLTGFHLHAGNPVERIFWGRVPLAAAASYLYFTKGSTLQTLLHEFKYRGNKEIGFYFGSRIGEALSSARRFSQVQMLAPLPLHYKKERRRGYNQAEILCQGIAGYMGLPVMPKVIERVADTQTQTRNNREARWKNMEKQFQLKDEKAVAGKHVLLVDDVITTGATLESCGAELLKAPGSTLSIVSLAYTAL